MIHPLAHVSPKAKIGNDVTIEPFASIHDDVEIGDHSWIGSNAVIWDGARLGQNVKIYPGASVSSVPQDLKFKGEKTHTFIGDNTVIREFATISRGTSDKWKTVIGKNCLVMAYVHIAHDCVIGDNCILVNAVQVAGHVQIDDWAIIGGATAVHQFVHVGAHVMISGGSLVRKDVPPFIKAAREPLSYAGINTVGLRRRGFSPEKINEIQDIYRLVFLNGNNRRNALEEVEKTVPTSAEKESITRFIRESERGVIKGFTKNSDDDE